MPGRKAAYASAKPLRPIPIDFTLAKVGLPGEFHVDFPVGLDASLSISCSVRPNWGARCIPDTIT